MSRCHVCPDHEPAKMNSTCSKRACNRCHLLYANSRSPAVGTFPEKTESLNRANQAARSGARILRVAPLSSRGLPRLEFHPRNALRPVLSVGIVIVEAINLYKT
jgi:hypothetical protein